MKSIELFAGVGGLAMGLTRAGFHHEVVIERDKDAAKSLRRNHSILGFESKNSVQETDSRDIDLKGKLIYFRVARHVNLFRWGVSTSDR